MKLICLSKFLRSGGSVDYDDGNNLKLVTKFYEREFSLNFHTAFTFNKNLSLFFCCQEYPSFTVCMYDLTKKGWDLLR